MPLFRRKNLSDIEWLRKHVKPDPFNREYLEAIYDQVGLQTAGINREYFILRMYLVLLQFLQDYIASFLPTKKEQEEFRAISSLLGGQDIRMYLADHLPDYQAIFQEAYIEFAAGRYQDYEIRNDGVYKLPGR